MKTQGFAKIKVGSGGTKEKRGIVRCSYRTGGWWNYEFKLGGGDVEDIGVHH